MSIPRCVMLVACLFAAGCVARWHRYEYAELHMGVQVRLTVYSPDEAQVRRACTAAFARIAGLEDIMSDYRPDSELMRLCAASNAKNDIPTFSRMWECPAPVSRELIVVLQRSQEVSERSNGAFDVTVGPYVALWRAARKSGRLPSDKDLQEAQKSVGWQYLKLDPATQTVALLRPNMRLDLGGIAKGYAGDEAIATLQRNGISRALFEAGGDIVAGDAPPGKTGWLIRIENAGSGAPQTIELTNAAISTSGDTAQFVVINDVRYSHVIDPRIGMALTNRVMATVIARDGITSDSLSTAACVLGRERTQHLIERFPGVRAYVRTID